MEYVTLWEDGYGVWLIPYPMKPSQHPKDIDQMFRWQWTRTNKNIRLSIGEYITMSRSNYDTIENNKPICRVPKPIRPS